MGMSSQIAKMRILRFWGIGLILCLVLGLSTSVQAEYYKYRDASGAIRFTDDILQVPADQRPQLKTYQSYEGTPAPAGSQTTQPEAGATDRSASGKPQPKVSDQPARASAAASGGQEPLLERKAQLETEQTALKAEYTELEKERLQLEQMGKEKDLEKDRNKRAQYRDKINRFNDRNQAYDARRRKFETERDQYYDLLRKASKM